MSPTSVFISENTPRYIAISGATWEAPMLKTALGARLLPNGNFRLPASYNSFKGLRETLGEDSLKDPSLQHFNSPWGFLEKSRSDLENHQHWGTLFPYQRDAISFLVSSTHRGALLALSPGLGKTLVSITAASLLEAERVLIVAPLSLLPTWGREIRKWASDQEFEVCWGSTPSKAPWVITNYDTLVRRGGFFIKEPWDIVIADESILVKNRSTLRWKSLNNLRNHTKRIWLLSGSPISRYADDLWAQFNLIDREIFPSYWKFAEKFCVLNSTAWGTSVVASRPEEDLRDNFRDIFFVRHQKDVLPDLPNLIFETIECPLLPEQERSHIELAKTFRTQLEGEELSVSSKLSMLLRLQQISSNLINVGGKDVSSKADALIELIETGSVPTPCIIWVHWLRGAQALEKRLGKSQSEENVVLMTGETRDRDDVIQRFRSGTLPFLILGTEVGKFGLTLIEAQSMIYFDRTFDSDAHIQSLHRVQRIGLKHRPLVITLRSSGTVDEAIEGNLSRKMKSIAQITNADLRFLLDSIVRKK